MRSKEVVEEVMRTMEIWTRKERKVMAGKRREAETHCHQTIEELFRVGMRSGEEGPPM